MGGKELRDKLIGLLSEIEGREVPQSYLHRALGASKSRISEILSELEREGLLERRAIGRSKLVYVREGAFRRAQKAGARAIKVGVVYSSEYVFLGYFREKLRELGLELEIKVYGDGLEVVDALGRGLIDLGLSPLVGQLYMYPVYRSYKVIAGGMGGGYRVLYREGEDVVYSSLLSTMDYVRYSSTKSGIISSSKTRYYHSPEELLIVAAKGGYVVTWNPLYKQLVKRGFKVVHEPDKANLHVCCSLAAANHLPRELVYALRDAYVESLLDYERGPERHIEYYSVVTGIPADIVKGVIDDYSPQLEISPKYVNDILSGAPLSVPEKGVYLEGLALS